MDSETRRLFVAFRRHDRLTLPIGILSREGSPDAPGYTFVYLKRAESLVDFQPLPGLSNIHKVHSSDTMFPVFANRLMSPERPDFHAWMKSLDLEPDADIFDVLERSGGRRVTDTLELFPFPERDGSILRTRFFVRGVRHVPGAEEKILMLQEGSRLEMTRDTNNPVSNLALHLADPEHGVLGFVPEYLVETIDQLQQINGRYPRVTVEQINRGASPSMMALCRMEAAWPGSFQPFSGPGFQPLVVEHVS